MVSKHVAFAIVVAGGILAACASRGGVSNVIPSGNSVTLPAFDPDMTMTAVMPKNTIGEEKPDEGLGTYKSPYWKATLGGYTEQSYSESLGFPPGTKITLKNLSKTTPHTLNVVEAIKGPPAKFPAHPNLQTTKAGNGILGTGFRSGIIQPGKSVTITLSHAGTYLIGCAFHYSQGMHDVFVVKNGAKPGQQGTPPPKGTPTPSTGPSPTGYGG
jgi:plastocyanin